MVDLKIMIPEPFVGDGKGMSWRDLSYRVKTYIQAVSPELRNATEKLEQRLDIVQDSELGTYKIDMTTTDALKSLLTVRT